MYVKDFMIGSAAEAIQTMTKKYGGPFGAAVVKNGKVIAICSNTVLKDHDPTAHAEVNAIRKACQILNTHDLSGCELYATGAPCPMCLSAIIWANIKTVYYSGKYEDCQQIGFRDDHIFKFIKDGAKDENVVKLELHDNDIAKSMYNMYAAMSGTIY